MRHSQASTPIHREVHGEHVGVLAAPVDGTGEAGVLGEAELAVERNRAIVVGKGVELDQALVGQVALGLGR